MDGAITVCGWRVGGLWCGLGVPLRAFLVGFGTQILFLCDSDGNDGSARHL